MKTRRLAYIYLQYLASVYVLTLVFMTLFRLVLYWSNIDQVADLEHKTAYLMKSLLIGLRFDNVIAAYVISLPLLVLSALVLINKTSIKALMFTQYFLFFTYSVVLGITAINIPYFKYFFKHFDYSAVDWAKQFGGDTFSMIFEEKSYIIYFIIFIAFMFGFYLTLQFLRKQAVNALYKLGKTKIRFKYIYIIPILIVWSSIAISMRGGISNKFPIRVSNAYFSEQALFNKLGINPFFYFLKTYSFETKGHNAIKYDESELNIALDQLRKEFAINESKYKNPVSRNILERDSVISPNIVLVFMESMSSLHLKLKINEEYLTPNLHRIISESYYFENFYSSGTHTNNAIVSSLYGYPTLFNRPMISTSESNYRGLPHILGEHNYENLFFITGDENYDFMNGFLYANGFSAIYSQKDYPKEKVINTFGVRDDYLFEFGLGALKKYNNNPEQNFLACFLTVTNHPPYSTPSDYVKTGYSKNELAVTYADSALGVFFDEAKKEDWYKNTIFLFVGDHGAALGKQVYDMPLSYSHVPFLIHSPLFDNQPKIFSQFGGQIDIYPTIMGLLGYGYRNDGMGIDIINEERPYIYFATDNYLGCIDNEFFYHYELGTKKEGLYHFREESTKNLIDSHPEEYRSMKDYAFTRMIVSDYIVKNELADDSMK